ncbi:MAG: hypothetical protein NTY64_12700 [Deltaproteobacteria bacterium]|nr:hypothetical protein [Deltaproteobacteria bacterium]
MEPQELPPEVIARGVTSIATFSWPEIMGVNLDPIPRACGVKEALRYRFQHPKASGSKFFMLSARTLFRPSRQLEYFRPGDGLGLFEWFKGAEFILL